MKKKKLAKDIDKAQSGKQERCQMIVLSWMQALDSTSGNKPSMISQIRTKLLCYLTPPPTTLRLSYCLSQCTLAVYLSATLTKYQVLKVRDSVLETQCVLSAWYSPWHSQCSINTGCMHERINGWIRERNATKPSHVTKIERYPGLQYS